MMNGMINDIKILKLEKKKRYIDEGDCWFDTEAKFTPIYDEYGECNGGYYLPYIPKCLIGLTDPNEC